MKRFVMAAVLMATLLAVAGVQPALAIETAASDGKPLVEGTVPASWNLPKPVGLEGATEYPPMLGVGYDGAGTLGGGTNNISFLNFDTGDFCCVFGAGFGHAGLFDGAKYHGLMSDYCMVSANVAPADGVQMEQPAKYRRYDKAYGLWVPSVSPYRRGRARDYANEQMGEPYALHSSKADVSRWYCSKLVWAAYKYRVAKDLDANGGYWVSPADLVNDRDTAVFAKGD